MIDITQGEFERRVRGLLMEHANKVSDSLFKGIPKDYSEYRYLLGRIHASSDMQVMFDQVANEILRCDMQTEKAN